jgi:hypothetical protein
MWDKKCHKEKLEENKNKLVKEIKDFIQSQLKKAEQLYGEDTPSDLQIANKIERLKQNILNSFRNKPFHLDFHKSKSSKMKKKNNLNVFKNNSESDKNKIQLNISDKMDNHINDLYCQGLLDFRHFNHWMFLKSKEHEYVSLKNIFQKKMNNLKLDKCILSKRKDLSYD